MTRIIIPCSAVLFALAPYAALASLPEDGLIAVLTSTASVGDKDAACRELKMVGTEKSVPALAALLTDEKLSHQARFALESMPYTSAGAVLREAVGKTKGLIRSGIIDSLGERRDASAVPIIAPSLSDPDDQVVTAAAWALGKIGTKEAGEALRSAHEKATGKNRTVFSQGLLLCANNLLKADKTDDSHTYFSEAIAPAESEFVRMAAINGWVRAMKLKSDNRIAGDSNRWKRFRIFFQYMLADTNAAARAAGESILPELSTGELCYFAAEMSKMPASSQIAILSAARIRGDRELQSAVLDALKNDNEAVHLAAIRALGSVGDARALLPLVQLVAKEGEIGNAAKESIAMLRGREIDTAIVNMLKAELDPKRRATWIDVIGFRRQVSAVDVLLSEAVHVDPIVRRRAMAALGQVAATSDVPRVIKGILAATPGEERDAAERAVVPLLKQIEPPERAVQMLDSIDASPTDRLELLPLAARFGSPLAHRRLVSALGDHDPKIRDAGLHALCNWPDASVCDSLLHEIDAAKVPTTRTMLVRAYARVVSTPVLPPNAVKKGTAERDAERLTGLKKAMELARQDDERAYILERASAIRTLDSLHFILPYVDQPALAEAACAAIAELAHHKELRDPNKSEFRPAIEKVLRTTKVQAVRDKCTRSRDQMNASK